MVELVDTWDLKSHGAEAPYRFKSCHEHHGLEEEQQTHLPVTQGIAGVAPVGTAIYVFLGVCLLWQQQLLLNVIIAGRFLKNH